MPNSQVHGAAAVVHPTALPPQMLQPPERNYSCVPSARPKVVCTQLVLKLAGSIADFTIDNSSALLGAICRYANVDMANVRDIKITPGSVLYTVVFSPQVKPEHLHQLVLELRVGRFVPLSSFPVLSVFLRDIEVYADIDDRTVPSADRSGAGEGAGSFAAAYPSSERPKSGTPASPPPPPPPATAAYPAQSGSVYAARAASPSAQCRSPPSAHASPSSSSIGHSSLSLPKNVLPEGFNRHSFPEEGDPAPLSARRSFQQEYDRVWQHPSPPPADPIRPDSESADEHASESCAAAEQPPQSSAHVGLAVGPTVAQASRSSSGQTEAEELCASLKLLSSPGGRADFGTTDGDVNGAPYSGMREAGVQCSLPRDATRPSSRPSSWHGVTTTPSAYDYSKPINRSFSRLAELEFKTEAVAEMECNLLSEEVDRVDASSGAPGIPNLTSELESTQRSSHSSSQRSSHTWPFQESNILERGPTIDEFAPQLQPLAANTPLRTWNEATEYADRGGVARAGVQASLTIDTDYCALVSDPAMLAGFKTELLTEFSRKLRKDSTEMWWKEITSLRSGSVIVGVFVTEDDPSKAAALEAQLRSGPLSKQVGGYPVSAVTVSLASAGPSDTRASLPSLATDTDYAVETSMMKPHVGHPSEPSVESLDVDEIVYMVLPSGPCLPSPL